MGSPVEGLINRSSFAGRQAGHRVSAIFNELYKKKTAATTSTTSRRAACRASWSWPMPSTARARPIRPRSRPRSRRPTSRPNQMVTGYNGVKFDDKGQNMLASSLITQMQGGQYVAVWPKDQRRRRRRCCPTRAGKRGRTWARPGRSRARLELPRMSHVHAPAAGRRQRPAARRGLRAVLVGPHPDLGHDERRQLRARRLRHAGHVHRRRRLDGAGRRAVGRRRAGRRHADRDPRRRSATSCWCATS